ncbi:MAG: methyltransferase domain-containing protein [Myxococcota bacterium]
MDRVRRYYSTYDEWGRLERPAGQLEFLRAMELVERFVPEDHRVLDLGSGPGRYAIALAERGHAVTLADASGEQLVAARDRLAAAGFKAAELRQADARDLSAWPDASFDTVVAFGPFYHLIDRDGRTRAAAEIERVLVPGGRVLAAVIPRLSGARGIIERAARRSGQVGVKTLPKLLSTGVFENESDDGFPEAWYPTQSDVRELFTGAGLTELAFVSLRGLGAGMEQPLLDLRYHKPELFESAMEAIRETSEEPSVVDVGGHAVWVGTSP